MNRDQAAQTRRTLKHERRGLRYRGALGPTNWELIQMRPNKRKKRPEGLFLKVMGR
jgi:hypothetical protein